MTPIGSRESQAAYVERILREVGHISAYGALYELRDELGNRRSITRLAAIIEPLRKKGWRIETKDGHGELATYVLVGIDGQTAAWRCFICGTEARMEPAAVLGGMGQGYCFACKANRYFQRKAA